MQRVIRVAAAASPLVASTVAVTAAEAQTLPWVSQGDPQTMDPHSQNESHTKSMNG